MRRMVPALELTTDMYLHIDGAAGPIKAEIVDFGLHLDGETGEWMLDITVDCSPERIEGAADLVTFTVPETATVEVVD